MSFILLLKCPKGRQIYSNIVLVNKKFVEELLGNVYQIYDINMLSFSSSYLLYLLIINFFI